MRINAPALREAAAKLGDESDYAIAKRARVSKSTVSRLLNGGTRPGVVTLGKFCDAYELDVNDLLVADDSLQAAA